MDSSPDSGPPPDPDLALLRRRLDRERNRRVEAERIGEQVTSDLFSTIEQLRSVQQRLLETADRTTVVQEIARELRQELRAETLRERVAERIGTALAADRCLVYVADPAPAFSDWVSKTGTAVRPLTSIEQAGVVHSLLADRPSATTRNVVVPDVGDPTWSSVDLRPVGRTLDMSALAMVPMWAGEHLGGAVVLMSRDPRSWTERDLAICEGVARELRLDLVRVHTHDQHQQLRRLEELDRARDAFVSNVSHELRTPLASINGYLELVRDGEFGPLSSQVSRAVEVISRNADRLRQLVEDLLTLSAYDAGEAALELTAVDVGRVVTHCADDLRAGAMARGVGLTVNVSPGLGSIRGDGCQLTRVLINVIGNAVKFTPRGGRVVVAVAPEPDGVAVVVSDTGIGIPADEQHLAFTRFFRSSLSTHSEVPGTGLGLALSRTIVELHGGTIALASEESRGTTVTISLPAGRLDRAVADMREAPRH